MKIVLMVAGSLVLLLALAFADPDNIRLMPSFSEHFQQVTAIGAVPVNSPDKAGISHAIAAFNRDLARAYLQLDAAALAAVPLDDRLRQSYVQEIDFLQKNGRALELLVGNVSLIKVAMLSKDILSVSTVEPVRVRYLNAKNKTEIVSYPEERYAMRYTLERIESGWKIVQVETMSVSKRDE